MTSLELSLKEQVEALKAEVSKWKTRAQNDSLTGCLRRESLMDLIAERKKFGLLPRHLTLAIIDADHFKKINDTYGHLVGDEVLRSLGKTLLETLPQNSMVCRMGGEEFVVILDQGPSEGQKTLETLRMTLSELTVKTSISKSIHFTVSVGATLWDSDKNILEATAKADAELYKAKAQGRNQVAFAA